jgi:cysteine desulfurase
VKNSRAYFDYNASAPLRPEAREAMLAALDLTGNASSVHGEGRRLRQMIEDARECVAALVGAKASEVVFTGGATEANNWVLRGAFDTVITTEIEHESILAPASIAAGTLITIGAGSDGVVNVAEIAEAVLVDAPAPGRALVSVQMANNETGVVQPVADIADFARAHGLYMHTDATQVAGRMGIDFAALGLDYLSMSGHKIGGPKGVGALVIRDGLELPALMRGGGQERRRRAGTENVPAIAGFGAAARGALADLARVDEVRRLRDLLETGVREIAPDAVVVGAESDRICNTSCIALPGQPSSVVLIKLDLAGIAVGAGSACSSGKIGGSHVMQAMGLDAAVGEAAIRVSIGAGTTEAEVASFLAAWGEIYEGAVRRRAKGVAETAPAELR